ncbi:MAG: hypothetical protein C5B49_10610 [Bdellovibrio sp.]|nr:MAG: hypothetical protein C5B49_10610 [Bdellovibrio sp.]
MLNLPTNKKKLSLGKVFLFLTFLVLAPKVLADTKEYSDARIIGCSCQAAKNFGGKCLIDLSYRGQSNTFLASPEVAEFCSSAFDFREMSLRVIATVPQRMELSEILEIKGLNGQTLSKKK